VAEALHEEERVDGKCDPPDHAQKTDAPKKDGPDMIDNHRSHRQNFQFPAV
jgi:hypothetical protein